MFWTLPCAPDRCASTAGAPLLAKPELAFPVPFAGAALSRLLGRGFVFASSSAVAQLPLIRASVNTSAIRASGNRRKSVRWRNLSRAIIKRTAAVHPCTPARGISGGRASRWPTGALLRASRPIKAWPLVAGPPCSSAWCLPRFGYPERGPSASLPKISFDSPSGSTLERFDSCNDRRAEDRGQGS